MSADTLMVRGDIMAPNVRLLYYVCTHKTDREAHGEHAVHGVRSRTKESKAATMSLCDAAKCQQSKIRAFVRSIDRIKHFDMEQAKCETMPKAYQAELRKMYGYERERERDSVV